MDSILKILGLIVLIWLAIWSFGYIAPVLLKILMIVVVVAIIVWVVRTMIRN